MQHRLHRRSRYLIQGAVGHHHCTHIQKSVYVEDPSLRPCSEFFWLLGCDYHVVFRSSFSRVGCSVTATGWFRVV